MPRAGATARVADRRPFAELAELLEAFDEALASRSCRVATVLGEAGAGKSRLVAGLVTVVGERAAVLEGRCVPYGEGITYFPLAIMLKPLAGIETRTPGDGAAEVTRLPADAEDSSLVVARLAGAIGLDDVLARPEEIAWAVHRLSNHLPGSGRSWWSSTTCTGRS